LVTKVTVLVAIIKHVWEASQLTVRSARAHELTQSVAKRICFPHGPMGSHSATARHYKMAPTTVSYTRRGMAEAHYQAQHAQTQLVMSKLASCEVRPAYVLDKLKWDETRQVASVLFDPLQRLRQLGLPAICDAAPPVAVSKQQAKRRPRKAYQPTKRGKRKTCRTDIRRLQGCEFHCNTHTHTHKRTHTLCPCLVCEHVFVRACVRVFVCVLEWICV
jgi:hypothetical protein